MKIYFLGTSHGIAEKGRFLTSMLIDTEKASYFIDLGAPIGNLMLDNGIHFEKVKAAFITHMHGDHTMHMGEYAALCNFGVGLDASSQIKYKKKLLYLPEENDIEAFEKWIYAIHEEELYAVGRCKVKSVVSGEFYDDGNIKITAIPTRHLKRGLSYAYLVEAEEKHVLFTGDLTGDFSDFPKIAEEVELDAVVCELTHFDIENALPILNKAKASKIIFNHVRNDKVELLKKNEEKALFLWIIANDGDVIEI